MKCNQAGNIITLLRCPVCLEDFSRVNQPVTLQCGHNLCTACIATMQTRRLILKCPIDGKNRKVTINAVNEDLLALVERTKTHLAAQPTSHASRSIQCEGSPAADKLQHQQRRTMRRIHKLHSSLQQLFERFRTLPVQCGLWTEEQAAELTAEFMCKD